ncbi:MAG: hypothetical protein HFF26_02225 [Oscillospiraceae bacterium]|jgi:hypothetical protein|nr:hypothetical protein [Oscillospiraceae bacterium]
MEAQLIKQEDGAVLKESACDTSDYLISVACGAIAGLVDIFFVGMPGESTLGTWTDLQVDTAVKKFASLSGWNPKPEKADSVASAIGWLEKNYRVNYDQRHTADVGNLFPMNTKNHHIKSLSHAPDIVGLFFSVLNQFTSTSAFISGGQLIMLQTETYELQGGNFPAKLFCGVANWFGHVMSDIAGSSGSRGNGGRGSGLAIPFFELFQMCTFGEFQVGKDRQDFATLAIRAFQEGYDARFGLAMAIPVLICDLSIRLLWMVKRRFYLKMPVNECIPTSRHSDLRVMLLFGNGTLCIMDGADAAIRSDGNWLLFFMRMNIIAWARFLTLVLKEICIRVGISATFEKQLDAYKQITASLRAYLLQLQQIDVEAFRRETEQFDRFAKYTDLIMDERQLNAALKASMIELGIRLPWDGDFDLFMRDKNKHLSFE